MLTLLNFVAFTSTIIVLWWHRITCLRDVIFTWNFLYINMFVKDNTVQTIKMRNTCSDIIMIALINVVYSATVVYRSFALCRRLRCWSIALFAYSQITIRDCICFIAHHIFIVTAVIQFASVNICCNCCLLPCCPLCIFVMRT